MSDINQAYTRLQGSTDLPTGELINPPKGCPGITAQVVLRLFHKVNGLIIYTEEVPITVLNMRCCEISMYMFMNPVLEHTAAPLTPSLYMVGNNVFLDVEVQLDRMALSSGDVGRYCQAMFYQQSLKSN
ncbi:hypothetical protein RAY_176 [Erwinia phage vB_EamM_RAY]|jgi:hypothetical protein|uniref:Uncharacterized protein n=10 Tax=Agricanvirus TaxID=1984776 RepID=A0A173GE96_9CAUD|nr:hypothetical protein Ea357_174 [Erwinia phage Ea35-70]YP_009605325.1 hypothetical protein FDH97_gp182 [Erwinia phage vB_EamM_Deimos-Minion]YP_009605643.1 hypothetical protein FDH98_gp176 [Erwinia phage vB_EamM_RAY]YP_009605963.1 hypothetical protein FDH99_gp179 [Erwinia phage vB_EamM_Simmy50]YP_009606284.1 hypothetical protein FDI00_gp178 [Erwinia phage vB_EamM_Special G]YP_009621918.1 hypothetical protein FDJ23_gp177 [Erwinia phage vB_EamM_Desertfox]AUG85965.1 hypothetical protein BOSOLAP